MVNDRQQGPWRVFWGDTHHNSFTGPRQEPPLEEVLAFAAGYLDFYTGAYYTPASAAFPLRGPSAGARPTAFEGHSGELPPFTDPGWRGVRGESLKDAARLEREWAMFQAATAAADQPGRFVAFPGYEWQGDGRWGDHNVICRNEGAPLHTPADLPGLYRRLDPATALAIPHHTGYLPGIRAPRWEYCDPRLSPFAEIYSLHGCSESDEERPGLRHNSHMGPGTAAGTWQAALDRGLRLGAIGSTDNWQNTPGCWNQGLAACLAGELSRAALWDAFRRRRVYAVTGDRIELDFTCNGATLGAVVAPDARREIRVAVNGQDALDRIEVLRGRRVIATYCHRGNWAQPRAGTVGGYKWRIETGWGPRPGEIPFYEQAWAGTLELDAGRFLGWSPCWVSPGQTPPVLAGPRARFRMTSRQHHVNTGAQGAVIFEFTTAPETRLDLDLNGRRLSEPVSALAAGSRILWYREACLAMLREATGRDPADFPRGDPLFYQYAFKAKLHRAIPEAGYRAVFSFTDRDPLPAAGTHYRVRVEQCNGQRAWSSPIWIAGRHD